MIINYLKDNTDIEQRSERRRQRQQELFEKIKTKALEKAKEKEDRQRLAEIPELYRILDEIETVRKVCKHTEFHNTLRSIDRAAKAIEKNKSLNDSSQRNAARLINYYLPLTLKLAKTFETLENNGLDFEGEAQTQMQVLDSLKEIEKAITRLNQNMISAVELGISTDAEVLETVMARDGLKKKDF